MSDVYFLDLDPKKGIIGGEKVRRVFSSSYLEYYYQQGIR
jgi:hypothetical protein